MYLVYCGYDNIAETMETLDGAKGLIEKLGKETEIEDGETRVYGIYKEVEIGEVTCNYYIRFKKKNGEQI